MLARVGRRALRAVANRAAAAIAMMTAQLNAVVFAAGRRVGYDRRRHQAHRSGGDQQTSERMGEGFHGTAILCREPDAD